MLAVSSSWIEDPTDLEAAVERIRAIGVHAVELEYRLTSAEIGPLLQAFRAAGIAVPSVHNFCPHPAASGRTPSGDLYDLASLDPAERARGVDATRATIRTALEAGARAVVLHLGAAAPSRTGSIRAAFQHGEDAVRAAVRRHLEERASRSQEHRAAAGASLERIDLEAARAHLRLGIETRVHLHEVPDEAETAWLLDAMRARGVTGYWHDVGHAHVRQVYGVGNELAWLERFRDSLVGLHLHDARGFHDHLIPGEGEIDFDAIAARVPREREVLFTLELGPAWPVERVRKGVLRLLAAGLH